MGAQAKHNEVQDVHHQIEGGADHHHYGRAMSQGSRFGKCECKVCASRFSRRASVGDGQVATLRDRFGVHA